MKRWQPGILGISLMTVRFWVQFPLLPVHVAYMLVRSVEPNVLWPICNNYHGYRDLEIFSAVQFHAKIVKVVIHGDSVWCCHLSPYARLQWLQQNTLLHLECAASRWTQNFLINKNFTWSKNFYTLWVNLIIVVN